MQIDLTPLYAELIPFVVAVVGVLLSWALHKIAVKYHLDALDSHRDVVINAVDNAISYAVKKLPATASANDKIAAAVNYVLPKVPEALSALKVTPDSLAQIVAARLPVSF